MEKSPQQQHVQEETSCAIASPSTFLTSEFQMEKSAKTHDAPTMRRPSGKTENKHGQSQEMTLWNQVATIRQEVCVMQENLNQLNSALLLGDGDTTNTRDTYSHFSISTKSDSLSSEDTLESGDEDSVIEGILVKIPSSISSSLDRESSSSSSDAASSCVSSLGLGGHETTNPLQFSSSLLCPTLDGEKRDPPATVEHTCTGRNTKFRRQNTTESSDESLTAFQEIGNFAKLLYFFALEFPIHLFSSLSESTTASNAKARSSVPHRSRRFISSLLAISILGGFAILLRKQCPRCFPRTPSIPRASQSCVTTTAAAAGPIAATNSTSDLPNYTSDLLTPSILSVRHPTMRKKRPRRSMTTRTTADATTQFLHRTVDAIQPSNRTRPIIWSGDGFDAALLQMPHQDRGNGKAPRPIVDLLRRQGQKIFQKIAKNNHKMWHRYPEPHSSHIRSQKTNRRDQVGAKLLKSIQHRGREIAQKSIKNNHKMWNSYPTIAPSREEEKLKRRRDKRKKPLSFSKSQHAGLRSCVHFFNVSILFTSSSSLRFRSS